MLAGVGALIVAIAAFGGTAQSVTPTPSASAVAECLAYKGSEAQPNARIKYPDSAFAIVDCRLPHHLEIIERAPDLSCEDAVNAVRATRPGPGLTRRVTADVGPTGCALGRADGDYLQTDTFRISATKDPIQTFAACTLPEDAEAYLDGQPDFARNVPCHSGMPWPGQVTGGDIANRSADENCKQLGGDVPTSAIRAADATTGDGRPSVRCIFVLDGVNEG